MIEKISLNSIYVDKLKNLFPSETKNIEIDMETNEFTNYIIYKNSEELVGFVNYYIMYDRAEIININVLEEYQKNGIGNKLLYTMIQDCISKNVKSITLEVRENNNKAIGLYLKNNFKTISKRKGYYNGIDALLMEKELI